ncbi:UNVERIFIED_ORG: capsular polysaccharide transport system permease protein [Ensifer adhaerens]|nr:capsular polysaccharide transport system permease protein [Ensifer adhaerens]
MSDIMVKDESRLTQTKPLTPVERSQKMAAALSSYARALTFENRSRRNLYRLAGLAPRTRDRVFSIMMMALIGITFVLPMVGSIGYYTFLASPGYVSQVRFIVRSSTPLLSRDRYSSNTVEPKEKIVQDTAILLNYLESPAIIQDMQKHVDLHRLFGGPNIDFLSRLPADATQDDMLKYWKKHAYTYVNPKSGIVEVEITAYSPQQAHDLVQLVLRLSEERVNKLSAGMWEDLRASTQIDVDQATREVAELRGKFRDTQNQTGVFDVDMSAHRIDAVLTTVESNIADLRGRRQALGETLASKAPQVADLERRIAAAEEQAKNLRAQIAGTTGQSESNLAGYSSLFDGLKLALSLAENRLTAAIKDLEKVKLVSSLQLTYVDNFIEPTLPDSNKYPNIGLSLFLSLLVCLAACGVTCGGLMMIRKKMD